MSPQVWCTSTHTHMSQLLKDLRHSWQVINKVWHFPPPPSSPSTPPSDINAQEAQSVRGIITSVTQMSFTCRQRGWSSLTRKHRNKAHRQEKGTFLQKDKRCVKKVRGWLFPHVSVMERWELTNECVTQWKVCELGPLTPHQVCHSDSAPPTSTVIHHHNYSSRQLPKAEAALMLWVLDQHWATATE